jgi:hypothetical protein
MTLLRAFNLAGLPGIRVSEDYQMTVDGQTVWVERHGEVSLARFAVDGPVEVVLTPRQRVDHFDIRPRSRRIRAEWAWNQLRFTMPGTGQLWVELPDQSALLIVASGPDSLQPPAGARSFGPGRHEIPSLRLEDGATLWLDGDALVAGGVVGSPHQARLMGPGVIDAGGLERPRKVVELIDAAEVLIDGPVLRAGPCWQNALIRCQDIRLRRATVISHGRNGDGVDVVASRRIRIEDCCFRCSDDCIALKCNVDPRFMPAGVSVDRGDIETVRVTRCISIGWRFADGFTIGFEARGGFVRDVVVEDCDVLYARGHSAANGHSAFSIICDGPAVVSQVRFERIRVEDDVFKNFELYVTHGGFYVKDGPGRIEDVLVRDVTWAVDRPLVLHGHDAAHPVRGVRFERCTVAGRPLTGIGDADLRLIGAVEDVHFSP